MKTLVKFGESLKKCGGGFFAAIADNEHITVNEGDITLSVPNDIGLTPGVYYPSGLDKGIFVKNETEFAGEYAERLTMNGAVKGHEYTFDDIESFKWVALAMSNGDSRPELNGLCLKEDKLVATNGHRLHMLNLNKESPDYEPIIPRIAVGWLIKLLTEYKVKSFKVTVNEDRALIALPNGAFIVSELSDAYYPDIARIIPDKNEYVKASTLDPAEFKKINREFLTLKKIDDSLGKVHGIEIGPDKARIKSELIKREYDVSFKISEGSLGFNCSYLADMCVGDVYHAKANDWARHTRPVLVENADKGLTGVLMPLCV